VGKNGSKWRHEWVPLNAAAAVLKAHGSHDRARRQFASVFKRTRRPDRLRQEFRAERDAQLRRFENHVRIGQNMSQSEYFGEGDSAGKGAVEKRLTFADFRAEKAAQRAEEKRYRDAYRAGRAHGLTGSQDDAAYDAALHGHDEETFGQGYTDGLIAREEARDRRRQAARARFAQAAATRSSTSSTSTGQRMRRARSLTNA
jgi:hypothetical protein